MLRKLTALTLALAGCGAYEPTPIANADVQLVFEKSVDNLGETQLAGESHDGNLRFARSETGRAYFSEGDGRWLEYETNAPIAADDSVEISFDVNRTDWTNPHEQGRAARTVAVISGRSEKRIHHISFNFEGGSEPKFYVSFDDADGGKHRLTTENGLAPNQWRNIRLRINTKEGVSDLLVDGVAAASVSATPMALETGVSRIKLGTWHKKNQAFRGRIDNFIISSFSAG